MNFDRPRRIFRKGDNIVTVEGWLGIVTDTSDPDGCIKVQLTASRFFDLLPPAALRKATVKEIQDNFPSPEEEDYPFMLAYEPNGEGGRCVAAVKGGIQAIMHRLDVVGIEANDPALRFVPVRLSHSRQHLQDWEEILLDLDADRGDPESALADLPEHYRYAITRRDSPAIMAKMTAEECVIDFAALIADNQHNQEGHPFVFGLMEDGWSIVADRYYPNAARKIVVVVSEGELLPTFEGTDHFDRWKADRIATLVHATKDNVIWPSEAASQQIFGFQIALDKHGEIVAESPPLGDIAEDVARAVAEARAMIEDYEVAHPIRTYRVLLQANNASLPNESSRLVYHGPLDSFPGVDMFCFVKD